MPRKKKPAAVEAAITGSHAEATAVAEPEAVTKESLSRPAYIDGPPTDEAGQIERQPKNWGEPYKPIFTSQASGFEMGENRRFKQRVFKFTERPADEIIARLKDEGFTYRAAEKAWTVTANPDTRKLSDELAREFAGQGEGMVR